jgi:hypothetical protein
MPVETELLVAGWQADPRSITDFWLKFLCRDCQARCLAFKRAAHAVALCH